MQNPRRRKGSSDPISEAQFAEAWAKLRLHTWKKYRWLHDLTGDDLDDIAHQALIDTWSGRRRWPPVDKVTGLPKNDVSLLCFLCETVRSIVSHRWEKTKATIPLDGFNSTARGPQFERAIAHRPALVIRPTDIEEADEYKHLTEKMLDLVSNDEEVFRVVKMWRAYPDLKPREIAEALLLTMPQMRAAQKRLRRLLGELRKVDDE
jgi:DNA-directed RNA polymerase specialized sigma24 family protein